MKLNVISIISLLLFLSSVDLFASDDEDGLSGPGRIMMNVYGDIVKDQVPRVVSLKDSFRFEGQPEIVIDEIYHQYITQSRYNVLIPASLTPQMSDLSVQKLSLLTAGWIFYQSSKDSCSSFFINFDLKKVIYISPQ